MTDDLKHEPTPASIIGRRNKTEDVLCVGTPPPVDLSNAAEVDEWKRLVTGITKQYVWNTHGRFPPFDIEWGEFEILITSDPDDVDAFYSTHDCERCRDGIKVAKAYLRADMTGADAIESVTLIKMPHVEVW